jgi:hypothetical protein
MNYNIVKSLFTTFSSNIITGGQNTILDNSESSIINGNYNYIDILCDKIFINGDFNTVETGVTDCVIIGTGNTITSNVNNVVFINCYDITGTTSNTIYIDNVEVKLNTLSDGDTLVYDAINNILEPGQISLDNIKSINLPAPVNSDNIGLFYTDKEITITKVNDVIDSNAMANIAYNIRYAANRNEGSPTDLWISPRNISSNAGDTTTSFDNPIIPANRWIWLYIGTVTGNPDNIIITIKYI